MNDHMVAKTHDNNFNLLRFFAATAVLYSHSYALTGNKNEPLEQLTGISLGGFAVDIFFVMSGYLVTASLVRIKNLKLYFLARVMRIYPALLVAAFFCVFIIGATNTNLPLNDFLKQPGIYNYILKNSTIIFGTVYELPGVFEENPFPKSVNGSLWTLRFELIMYLILGVIGWICLKKSPNLGVNIFKTAILKLAIISMATYLLLRLIPNLQQNISNILLSIFPMFLGLAGELNKLCHFAAIFFYGATLFCFQTRIKFDLKYIISILFLLTIMLFFDRDAFFVTYNLSIGYLVISLAFLSLDIIKTYNRIGDFSYGLYIYAFPIQQSVVINMPDLKALELFVISFPITLSIAYISWYSIEKPILGIKKRLEKNHPKKIKA